MQQTTRIYLLVIMTFVVLSITAQNDTIYLHLNGEASVLNENDVYSITVLFSNKMLYEPVMKELSPRDRKIEFSNAIAKIGINFNDFVMDIESTVLRRLSGDEEYFYYITTSLEDFIKIREICIKLGYYIEGFDLYPDPSVLDRKNEVLLESLRSTRYKAKKMAKHLGYEKVELMSISDIDIHHKTVKVNTGIILFKKEGVLVRSSLKAKYRIFN